MVRELEFPNLLMDKDRNQRLQAKSREQRFLNMEDIASVLHASVRTIKRDCRALQKQGIPLNLCVKELCRIVQADLGMAYREMAQDEAREAAVWVN